MLIAACGSPPVAVEGDSVTVHYTGTLDDGSVFDSSREGEPLQFVIGDGRMIGGFDAAVRGMAAGDTVTVRIESADAYGEPRADQIVDIPINMIPGSVSVGDPLTSSTGQRFVVTAITGEMATLDGNHPLAGAALTFAIELIEIGDGS